MNLYDYDKSHPYTATVTKSERITPENDEIEVRHIVLEVKHPGFIYVEGQSIGVVVPGPHEFGNEDHFRLYSIASSRNGEENSASRISICVRRCFYIDEVSGERYPGVASNYLCDRGPGDEITITGPYGRQFVMPRESDSNLLMFGVGTGIAPFRAFVKHIYDEKGGWTGKVRLFYGAQSGTELLYMNQENDDFGQYYDEGTFKAFEAVSPRPHVDAPVAMDKPLEENAAELRELLDAPNTYVYVAGLEKALERFHQGMATVLGSEEAWQNKIKSLRADDRWSELLY